jgi:serine/threonine protein kinase
MPDLVDPPPPERLRALDAVCDAFEALWKKGSRPVIEEILGRIDEDLRPMLQQELIRTEVEWRCRLGEEPSAEEYRTRFPVRDDDLDGWITEARRSGVLLSGSLASETASQGYLSPATGASGTSASGVAPPRTLGEYDLLDRLGAGGMGEVYKARHRRLDKLVAIKLLGGRLHDSGLALARFLREMKAAGALEHPNVVEAIDAGEQNGVVYLVMKLVAGTDLEGLVRERGPLPIAEACDAARQTAIGLHYLHERGLIHRDIKASNLMRTPDGTVKILDLGLARWREGVAANAELTITGAVMGTPEFLAPEQIGALTEVGVGADLYGLGGTLFYLLTGQAPFAHRRGLDAKLQAHRSEEAPDVRALRPGVPAALAALVHRLLAKDPAQRPASAAVVADELVTSTGRSVPAGTNESYPQVVSVWRRKPWLAWVAAASAATIVTAVATAIVLHNVRPKETESVSPAAPVPLRVESLKVEHYANVLQEGRRFDEPRGVLGRQSFDTRLDDSVTVTARLSHPAYSFLIAYRPDGTEELCFPESNDSPPTLDDKPRYPSVSRGVNYGLNEGTGLMVFAVVASSEPLPAYKEWKTRRGASPWKHVEVPSGIVWWDDGETVGALTMTNPIGQRGRIRPVAGKTPIVELTNWLRQGAGVETAAGVGFAVMEKAKQ